MSAAEKLLQQAFEAAKGRLQDVIAAEADAINAGEAAAQRVREARTEVADFERALGRLKS